MSGNKGKELVCILCGAPLGETTTDFLLVHPRRDDCKVVLTDVFGVSADDFYELIAGDIFERSAPEAYDPDVLAVFEQFTPVEKAILACFDMHKVPRLGGASGDRGWSSFATWQRCPFLWKRTYVDHIDAEDTIKVEAPGRAIGTLVHTHLAVHYQKKIDKRYPITPEILREYLSENNCNPEFNVEAWRLFTAYRLYYKTEQLRPIAVEHHLVDPRTGESTRYDLIAEVLPTYEGREPGIYAIDHKTAQRFDDATLTGWVNDGTIIQQATLWHRMGLHRRFGALTGVIANLIGKQKVPELCRTFIAPNRWQMEQQTADLKVWQAQKSLAIATDVFPRARGNCIGRYGKCSQFEFCATGGQ